MKVFAVGVLALLFLSEAPAKEMLVYGTSFSKPDSISRLLKGNGQWTGQGLTLSSGSVLRMRQAADLPPRNGAIRFGYRTFRERRSSFFILSEEKPASSLKVVLGRWVVDLNEDSLHVGVLDSTYSRIENIFESAPIIGDSYSTREVEVSWLDRRVRIMVGGKVAMETPRGPDFWEDIDFWVGQASLCLDYFELASQKRDSLVARDGSVDIIATFRPRRFDRGSGIVHHALVWSGGRSQPYGLFETAAPDSAVYAALLKAGGKPGNSLTPKAWDSRFDEGSKEPNRKASGDEVTAEIIHGGRTIAFKDLVLDGSGKPVRLRFSGNGGSEKIWNSGCILCLHSCPAAKVGNASYSVRNWMRKETVFRLADSLPLRDGDEVILRLNLPEK